MNNHLIAYAKEHNLKLSRSRPYRKNDIAHVEQRNGFLRKIVGYDRLQSAYTNMVLPSMKLVYKHRLGSKVQKRYDTPKTPLARITEAGVMVPRRSTGSNSRPTNSTRWHFTASWRTYSERCHRLPPRRWLTTMTLMTHDLHLATFSSE